VGRNLSIADGRLQAAVGEVDDDVGSRLDDALTRLEVVSGTANTWRAGPVLPAGDYHLTNEFGLLIETDRPAYLGECTVDADSTGRFSPALYEYDPEADALGAQVETMTVRATGGRQTIYLDFLMDEPGQYLLTRLLPRERHRRARTRRRTSTVLRTTRSNYGAWRSTTGSTTTPGTASRSGAAIARRRPRARSSTTTISSTSRSPRHVREENDAENYRPTRWRRGR